MEAQRRQDSGHAGHRYAGPKNIQSRGARRACERRAHRRATKSMALEISLKQSLFLIQMVKTLSSTIISMKLM